MEQTFIEGKAACLEATISHLQTQFSQAGFELIEASWQNPVPYIYSLHLKDTVCPSLFTNGKGASRKATQASALGEFLERLETNYFFADFNLQGFIDANAQKNKAWCFYPDEKVFSAEQFKACLTPDLWSFYDPDEEWMAEDLFSLQETGEWIRCLPLTDVVSQQTVYFPVNLLNNLYASNGLSAGNTLEEAAVQGLSEIFERWVKGKILRENLCLPEITLDQLSELPTILQAIAELEAKGLKVSVRDASLGGRYPVVNVTLFDQKGACFASFGAHPLFEVALERTLTESLQGRQLQALDGFQMPTWDVNLVASDENIENHFIDSSGLLSMRFISQQADFDYQPWANQPQTIADQWRYLVDLVCAEGHQVYLAHYATVAPNQLTACRVIVPGLSEIYPVTEVLDSNQNKGRELTQKLLALEIDDVESIQDLLEELDYLGFADHQNVANLIGLLPDQGSYWQIMKIIDLKLWAYLALQDREAAAECLEMALVYMDHPDWKVDYQALQFCLELTLDDLETYDSPLAERLFGEARIDKIKTWLKAEVRFAGLVFGSALFQSQTAHQGLIETYQRFKALSD